MHVGYSITSKDLSEILCFSADKTELLMAQATCKGILNKALCVSDLTEGKNILKRLRKMDKYRELLADVEVNNIARVYNHMERCR